MLTILCNQQVQAIRAYFSEGGAIQTGLWKKKPRRLILKPMEPPASQAPTPAVLASDPGGEIEAEKPLLQNKLYSAELDHIEVPQCHHGVSIRSPHLSTNP